MAYVVDSTKVNSGAMNTFCSVCRFIQLFSFIIAFLSFIYWFLNCLEIQVAPFIRFILEIPYGFVRLFGYISQGTSADFTGAIVGAFFLCMGFFFNFVADSVEQMVVSLMRNQSVSRKIKNYDTVQKPMHKERINPGELEMIDLTRKKFIFLLDIKVTPVNIAVTTGPAVEADKLRKRISDAIIDNLNMNKLEQCGFYKKNLFIVYKECDYIDNFIYYIKATLDSLSKEFASPQLMIDFNVSFSIISSLEQLEAELILMDTILNLNMVNEFITTSKFKSMYDNRERTKYVLVPKGVYNLSRNLSISNNQDIFSIRERRL